MATRVEVRSRLITAIPVASDFVVSYPAGLTQADFTGSNALAEGVVAVNDNEFYQEADAEVVFDYGAGTVEVTNNSGVTWPAGALVRVQLTGVGAGTAGVGPQGPRGLSAYQIAVAAGFVGNEAAWLASLAGAPVSVVEVADGPPDPADPTTFYWQPAS